MSTIKFGSVYVPTEEGDHFISVDHERIAQIIQDYDPNLRLVWIPTRLLQSGDQQFAVVERTARGDQVVFYSDTCDERLLARVFEADNKNSDFLKRIEKLEAARQAIELKKEMEKAEERQDLVKHIIKSPKHVYKHNGVRYE